MWRVVSARPCARVPPDAGEVVVARQVRPSGTLTMIAPIVFLTICCFIWWALAFFSGVESWRLPSPLDTLRRGSEMLTQASMWRRIALTFCESLAGSILGACVALPLAYLIYRSRIIQAGVEPFLGATQALPAIALAPLLVLWIGYGLWPIVALCALIVFFPILVSTVVGLRKLNSDILDAAELDGASGWTMVRNIELPLASASILAGLRNGFTLSVTGALVGEMVMGGEGLGQVLTQSRTNVDTAGMFVTIFILCAMATLMYVVIYSIERSQRMNLRD